MATAATVVADHEGTSHAITTRMTNLVAGPADHVTEATTEGSANIMEGSANTTEGRRPTPFAFFLGWPKWFYDIHIILERSYIIT